MKANIDLKSALLLHKVGADGITEDRFLSDKVVTTAGVEYIIQSFLDSTTYPMDAFSWHAVGIGTGAEAIGDTDLGSEIVAGRVEDAAPSVGAADNIFRTVGSFTFAATLAITEHGVFTLNTGGTLLDRSRFSAINVAPLDSVDFIYEFTLAAGG